MVDAKVVVILRNGDRVESELMDEQAARLELARVHGEMEPGRANKFVKLGMSAIFNAEDVDRVVIEQTGASH
jgi:hypothetical protein